MCINQPIGYVELPLQYLFVYGIQLLSKKLSTEAFRGHEGCIWTFIPKYTDETSNVGECDVKRVFDRL